MQYDENSEKYGYEGEMTPMKCDELESKDYNNGMTAYELMEENGLVNTAKKVKEAIEELKDAWRSEHEACEVLKQKLENVQASAYAESVDAGMRERRLRRALYKACAKWAHHRVFVRFNANEKAWENMERKCRAKAEEYR